MGASFEVKNSWNAVYAAATVQTAAEEKISYWTTPADGLMIARNGRLVYSASEREGRAELLVHSALCVHPEPSRVLIVGGEGSEVIEAQRHTGFTLEWLPVGGEAVAKRCFPERAEALERVTTVTAPSGEYDVIIIAECYEAIPAGLTGLLSKNGLMTRKATATLHEPAKAAEELKAAGEGFWIAMPFLPATPWARATGEFYIFASKIHHPTADLILQRADFLEETQVYTPELHMASFVLPRYLVRHFRGIAKN